MNVGEMTDRQAARWELVRARGKLRYIVVRGVLLWGLVSSVLYAALAAWVVHEYGFRDYLLRALCAFPLAGILWGVVSWWLQETQHAAWARAQSAGERRSSR